LVAFPGETRARESGQRTSPETSYAIVVKKTTADNIEWKKVVASLKAKHHAAVIVYDQSVEESLGAIQAMFPRFTCFVVEPTEATGDFVKAVHQLTRRLDSDPYTDTFWGILTGYDADNALEIAKLNKPLVVKNVASGTEFAAEMVSEGQWYDELVKNKHVTKDRTGNVRQSKGPDDTTEALVKLLNDYQADLMITSGHATQGGWQIGFRYRNGFFRSQAGQMHGVDTQGKHFDIDSPNPKVYLPIGNCLMGDINGSDAMALAWMNDVGVKQMIGYVEPTWFGYMGWGVLDYFVEQPGRFTLTEAFLANNHALIHRLNDPATPKGDLRGLAFDRDVVAFYGDPKWEAKMAEMPKYYDQTLEIKDGVYTLTIKPNRGKDSFKPVNTNGSQRGWRPVIQFLPHRVKDVEFQAGEDLKPTVTDDFILIPNPRECDPQRQYIVRFNAKRK
jgi:zinc protease